jgi:hypothetical protein
MAGSTQRSLPKGQIRLASPEIWQFFCCRIDHFGDKPVATG